MGEEKKMTAKQKFFEEIPLFISRSLVSTEVNKTGSWRFVCPEYDEKTAPCSAACPAGEDIPRIEMLVARGMFREAYETILNENPFPGVCGRVCFHPCEGSCNREGFDQSVGIHHLERFVGDMAIQEGYLVPRRSRPGMSSGGGRIAIAGAGPAGLAAAFFLTRLKYRCDVFEAETEPGGVLRWGIPSYRLPDDVLKKEIDRIVSLGVNIYCKKPVTQNFLEEIKGRYDAVFIGCGYGRSIQMNIPGEAMADDGLEFLCNIRKGKAVSACGVAAVIGGGNTAIDVARSLVRLGSKPVLAYRRRREDMPAFGHELEMALKEGVELKELIAPIRMKAERGNIALHLQKMKLAGSGKDGRARVVPDGKKTVTMKVQQVFTAIGAEPGENWYVPPKKQDNILSLSHCTLMDEEMPMVFGGDLTNPVKSVADAIASGKEAAMALDTLFRKGRDAVEERLASCRVGDSGSLSMEIYMEGDRKNRNPHIVSFDEINADYFQPAERKTPRSLSPDESSRSFSETEQTFTKESATEESERCFNCGICNDCDNCRLFCPELSVLIDNTRRINLDYCKGCGICVVECPRNAMSLEKEELR
ncbi:FAD-dependent oxidoreductase [Desulfobacterales bacterium HSG2]|nr:FAD-dependent oxidoreductase [Desulfobacterales bacterium HSG2]